MHLLKRILTAVRSHSHCCCAGVASPHRRWWRLIAALVALLAVQEFLKSGRRPTRSGPCAGRPTFSWDLFFLLLAIATGLDTPLLSTAVFIDSVGFAAAIAPFRLSDHRHGAGRSAACLSSRRWSPHSHSPTSLCRWDSWCRFASRVGRILVAVFAAGGLGGRHFRLLRRQVAGTALDVAARQPKEDLGRSAGFPAGQPGSRHVDVQLRAAHQQALLHAHLINRKMGFSPCRSRRYGRHSCFRQASTSRRNWAIWWSL